MLKPLMSENRIAAWGTATPPQLHELRPSVTRWGFRTALAATLLLVVALIPAVASQPRAIRSNGPWHTVKASRICERSGEPNQDLRSEKIAALPKGVAGEKLRPTVPELAFHELDGLLPLPPLRSPPQS